jgi:post-segregation antitoxin (ccd killing protein)
MIWYAGKRWREANSPVDVTIYLPDKIGSQAKEAGLNLSRMLRDAVTDELERRATVSKTLEELRTYELEVEDADGRVYTGRIVGTEIAAEGVLRVFLTDDDRVVVYNANKLRYDDLSAESTLDVGETLREWLRRFTRSVRSR